MLLVVRVAAAVAAADAAGGGAAAAAFGVDGLNNACTLCRDAGRPSWSPNRTTAG